MISPEYPDIIIVIHFDSMLHETRNYFEIYDQLLDSWQYVVQMVSS